MNIVLCVCSIFLKEFEGKLRVFSQLRVSVNNERVSSRQVLFFGLFLPFALFPYCGRILFYMETKCYSAHKEICCFN